MALVHACPQDLEAAWGARRHYPNAEALTPHPRPQDLEAAYEHMGGLHQARRLIDKLERGERIITVAIGSSFIASNSGCWQVRSLVQGVGFGPCAGGGSRALHGEWGSIPALGGTLNWGRSLHRGALIWGQVLCRGALSTERV